MKYQQWAVLPQNSQAYDCLTSSGISSLLAGILSARGYTSVQEVRPLLTPWDEPMPDPLLMKDMKEAVQRIYAAIARGETIAVYGDYDVDGITSTCLLTDYLSQIGGKVVSYIPDRIEEGYGLNTDAVATLSGLGVTLIVTVDCGITAAKEVEYAHTLGIDVVITDHHECKECLPHAVAVVDPHRPDCPYPFKGLAGVGVALKLVMALAGAEHEAFQAFQEYCDLAAVGTVADVMPMTGENRTIVQHGLAVLEHPRRLGLAQLIRESNLGEKPLTSVSIGYTLAPRINAAGRMWKANIATELLLTRDPLRASLLAQELCALNRERQTIEGDIFQECVERLEQSPPNGVIVLASEHWHQGVVGIVASRLAEKYACPTFMVCLDHGAGKGSCRSWGGINLFQLLSACSDLLDGFGGHALAAGFTVQESQLPQLTQRLTSLVQQELQGSQPLSVLTVDKIASPHELTVEEIQSLDLLEPCGTGNPRPILALTGTHVLSAAQVGRGRHLKLKLEVRGTCFDAIFFSADGGELGIGVGSRIDVAFYPQINEFRGTRTVQLQLVDLRHAMSRSELERQALEKYHLKAPLSPDEARILIPERSEFASLWRYLQMQCTGRPYVEQTIAHISKTVARTYHQKELPHRTTICLEVMEERGLLSLTPVEHTECIQITLHPITQKVDLEASSILKYLHTFLS